MRANWGLVLLPPLVLSMILLFGPQIMFLRASFFEDLGIGRLGPDITFVNYILAFTDSFYYESLILNFQLSASVTLLSLFVAFPVAYRIARMTSRWAMIVLAAIIVSAFLSVAIKILGMMILFAANGVLNSFLLWTGIITDTIGIIGTIPGIIFGLVHLSISFKVLMLFSVIQTVPRSLEEAAEIHGAKRWRVYWRVVIPLSLPGIISVSLLSFNLVMGAFVSALVLGGGKIFTLPVLIQQSLMLFSEFGMSAALSALLMLFVFTINIISVILVTRVHAARLAVT
jgi:putative spermidine/putrescine transport system permease protein